MKDSLLQLAKREMHALASNRMVWIGLLAASLILGLAGPFGTGDVMRLGPRILYWLIGVVVTFFTGALISEATTHQLLRLSVPFWPRHVIAGVIVGLVVSVEILTINWVAFGIGFESRGYLIDVIGNVIAVSVIVTMAFAAIYRARDMAPALASNTPTGDRLLSRLPIEKRGDLISISVTDHYVEVTTTKGRELILMRLSDAIAETEPTRGLQIHRSHWVARAAVQQVRRDGARAILTLSDGRELPASRTYVPALREAGLLAG